VNTCAIYVLANDAVEEWFVALLHSLRRHLPGAKVRLVPFDHQMGRLRALQSRFDFEIFEHESSGWLVEIGKKLEIGRTPYGPNWFKRFTAFFGPDDAFAYLDARTLVLSDLSVGFEALESGTVDLVHFGGDPNQSFETGPIRTQFSATGRCFGFNSGLWLSRRSLFSKEEMCRAAEFCVANRGQMNPRNTDQFFLNVLCALTTTRVANFADFEGRFTRDPWAFAHPGIFQKRGEYRVWAHGGMSHGRVLPLVHWAGIKLSPAMPLRRLWTEYRFEGSRPLHVKLEPLTALPARAIQSVRRAKLIRRFVSSKNAGL
jgi:hypothetical protein